MSPAHLLLVERLIEILMGLLRVIDRAAEGTPDFRRSCTRLVLSRTIDKLTRLHERHGAARPEPGQASPERAPSTPPARPLVPPVSCRPTPPRAVRLSTVPRRRPFRSKAHPTGRPTHVHIITI